MHGREDAPYGRYRPPPASICDENIAPVVMLTAFSQPDLVRQATGAGAMAYVTKPYEESKLLPALEVAMGRFAEINDLLDNVERSESKLHETEEQLKKAEEQLKKADGNPRGT